MEKIDLRSIPDAGKRVTYEVAPDSGLLGIEDEGVTLGSPLLLSLDIQKAGERKFMVRGKVEGTLLLRCDRCLNEFPRKAEIDFMSFFSLPAGQTPESEVELNEEDLDVEFRAEEEIDVLDIVREQILLDLPMKRVCREGCKGLCVKCGSDLNEGPCGCEREVGHPAFEKLKELKTKGDE